MNLSIRGIQEAQQSNLAHIRALQPDGALGFAIRGATIMAHQSAVRKTHVLTGSLRASHRIRIAGLRGLIFIDPTSINPRSKSRPVVYGPGEHSRGGSHAFYERVQAEDGNRIARAAANEFLRGFAQ